MSRALASGLRSGLKTFRDLVQDASWSKRALVELYPGYAVSNFSLYSGNVYVAPVLVNHDGVRLDVSRVSSVVDAELTRSRVADPSTLAAGEFLYDVDAGLGAARWDDGVSQWDDGVTQWDQFPALYVRMSDDSDPNDAEIEAELLLAFSSHPETHPVTGPSSVDNGDFEDWTAGSPDDWTVAASTVPAGGTVAVSEGSDPLKSSSCLTLTLTNVADGGYRDVYQAQTVVAAGRYRLSFGYRTTGSGIKAQALIYDGTNYVQTDGRTVDSGSDGSILDPTHGEWRRATWDFEVPSGASTATVRLRALAAGIGNGTVDFDDVKFMPLDRTVFYEPRISGGNVPSVSTASNDIFFGGKQVGVGGVTLLNQDAYFESLGYLDWINRKCIIRVGGGYLPDSAGSPTLIASDDYRQAFTGLIQEVKVSDTEAAFSLQDIRSTYFKTLPPNTYDESAFPGIARADIGKVRPLFFGAKQNIKPVRIDTTSNGYGVYELADCDDAPNGIKAIDDVHFYVDEAAAADKDFAQVISNDVLTGQHANEYPRFKRTDPTLDQSANVAVDGRQNVKKDGGADNAWNAGAYSSATTVASTEDAYVEATVGGANTSSCRGAFGLTTSTADYDPATMDFAVEYTEIDGSGEYHIWDQGSDVETLSVVPQRGDRVRVQILDTEVTIHVNGVVVYTSSNAASGTYYVRAMFYRLKSLFAGVGVYKSTTLRYTKDLANGQFTVTADPGPYVVEPGDNKFSFYHSDTHVATLQPGLYDGDELAFQAGAAMAAGTNENTHDPETHQGTYSESDHTITFAGDTAFKLLVSSGDETGAFSVLGFTSGDTTSATSVESDTALFSDPDIDHVVRVYAQGFKDDASGTYTGTGSALIEVGADILRAIALIWLKRPASAIDSASFQQARDRAPESLGVYMNKSIATKAIFKTLEFSNIANISIGGDGTLYYDVYVGDVPTGTVTISDVDFTAFGTTWEASDVYKTVRVYYNEDPTTGDFPNRYVTNNSVQSRFGRPDSNDFQTWINSPDGAQAAANRLGELARAPARQLRATVRGKLLDHRIGQKVRVTRDRAAGSGGLLSSSVYRILSLRQNYAEGLTQVQAIPDVVTVAGVACVSTCQSFCQTTCQESCESSCQTQCQTTCQVGCQVSCQSCDQTGCQETCEISCQTGCEATCQVACQASCQTACQASCQAACQQSCQTGCETSCQDTCETGCQTTCEVACQDTCEINCQTSCQIFCQASCQVQCQSSYEYFP